MSQRAPSQLSPTEVLRLRLAAQLLDAIRPRSPGEVVTWFGAMQAQDLNSGHWSFGARCDGLTDADVHAATENREILRTWPMRGTVHFVPPADARWMLEVTGARALRGAARRREFLGLSETGASAVPSEIVLPLEPVRAVNVKLLTLAELEFAAKHRAEGRAELARRLQAAPGAQRSSFSRPSVV